MSNKFGLNKWLILLAVTILAIVFTLRFLRSHEALKPHDEAGCKTMYDSIEADLEKSNYCAVDNDCDFIMLGGAYVKFGCYHYINKAVDKGEFYQKMNSIRDIDENML